MTAITITYTHVCTYVLARPWIGLRMSIADTLVSHMYNSVPQQTEPLTTSARTSDKLGLRIDLSLQKSNKSYALKSAKLVYFC